MRSWTCFLLGNALVVAVLIIEITTLRVCFDEFEELESFNDDRYPNGPDREDAYEAEEAQSIVYNIVMVALIAGVSLEVVSLAILSCTYRAPLDAKSAHKIPADDRGHCLAGFIARFLAPFTWGVICVCIGAASYLYNLYSPCGGGPNMSERTRYVFLVIFGLLMAICGGVLVVVSLLMACFACAVEPWCLGWCCRSGRRCMQKRVLAIAWFFDLWWQLAVVMWTYRTGGIGLNITLVLLAVNIVGEIMSECGSSAPLDV